MTCLFYVWSVIILALIAGVIITLIQGVLFFLLHVVPVILMIAAVAAVAWYVQARYFNGKNDDAGR